MSIILKVDHTVTYIEGKLDSVIYKNLKRELGYTPENIYWMKKKNAEGNKQKWKQEWDGVISCVCWNKAHCKCHIKKEGTHFPSGLISKACSFFKKYGIQYKTIDIRSKTERDNNKYTISDEFEIRDYQQEIIEKVSKKGGIERGIIKIATGGGKSPLACGIIANIGVSPSIFYVPSIDLLKQTKDEIEKFVRYHGVPVKVGMIGGGEKSIEDITVMTVQTAVRSLGGVWVKYDDEDMSEADNVDIKDIKKDIKDLIQNSKLMMIDECQHCSSETCQIISDNSISCQYRYGMSVGPYSNLELYGWIYQNGALKAIEDLWDDVVDNSELKPYYEGSYEIIDICSLGLKSRGWNDQIRKFAWKKVKKIIRHQCDKNARRIYYRGKNNIIVTDDHSVFCIPKGSDKNKSNFDKIESSYIDKKDILIADNGDNWNNFGIKENFNIFEFLKDNYKNPNKIRVKVDLSDLSYKDLDMSYSKFYQIIKRKSGIDLNTYLKFKYILPKPERIYTEGANGVGISPDFNFESLSFLMGFFIGDGWFDGNRINFAVEEKLLNHFLLQIKHISIIFIHPKIRKMEGKSYEVRISNALLSCCMKYFLGEKYCYEKFVPSKILFEWDVFCKMRFINGMMMSDGSYQTEKTKNKQEARYTTTSTILADTFACLLRSLGVSSSLSIRKPKIGGIINGRRIYGKRESYQIIFSMNSLLKNNEGKKGEIKKFKNISCNEYIVNRSQKEDFNDYVYDLEMGGHPSFVANGVLVHNSATPWRDQGDDILIDACFGKCIADINASFLIKRGYLVKPSIYFCTMKNIRGIGKLHYQSIYKKAIVENKDRNKKIVDFANFFLKRGRKTLILVKQIEHGKILESMIPESVFLYGETSKKKREKHLDKMRNGEPQISISSVIFDEGINVQPLDSLILAGSGKSATRALQRIGRTLRPYPGKKDAIIVDFMDTCKYLLTHSKKRESIYKTEEEFEILRPADG